MNETTSLVETTALVEMNELGELTGLVEMTELGETVELEDTTESSDTTELEATDEFERVLGIVQKYSNISEPEKELVRTILYSDLDEVKVIFDTVEMTEQIWRAIILSTCIIDALDVFQWAIDTYVSFDITNYQLALNLLLIFNKASVAEMIYEKHNDLLVESHVTTLFLECCQHGAIESLKWLLPKLSCIDDGVKDKLLQESLSMACKGVNHKTLEWLLGFSTPENIEHLFITACAHGNLLIVEYNLSAI